MIYGDITTLHMHCYQVVALFLESFFLFDELISVCDLPPLLYLSEVVGVTVVVDGVCKSINLF